MRTRSASLVVLARVLVCVLLSRDVIATSPQAGSTSYADIIDLYRRGDDQLGSSLLLGGLSVLAHGALFFVIMSWRSWRYPRLAHN